MNVSRPPEGRKKRRGGYRFLFVFAATTTMVATGGFGAFPDNPLTQSFQQVISENVPSDYLNPFNSYMENISAPTIQPQPASASEDNSSPDPLGFIQDLFSNTSSAETAPPPPAGSAIVETAMAAIEGTQTQLATVTQGTPSPTVTPILTQTQTQTSVPTQTSLFTQTSLPTATLSPIPTWTLSSGIVLPTSTKKPRPTNTPTITPTPTATIYPAGYNITNVAIDGISGATMYYPPGASFTVTYDYSIWSFSSCPGCIFQIVTGLGAGGVGTSTCGYDGQPGVPPGISGSAIIPMTAPVNQGIFTLNTESQMQYTCADAINAYGGSGPSIGEILVWSNADVINVWTAGDYTGNLGGRSGADGLCASTRPGGVASPNIRALIAISDTDSIANMPSNYGVPTGKPFVFWGGYLVAKNWADLVDGSVNTSFASNGVSSGFWWSGTENDAGMAIPATSNCFGFTSASSADSGNVGNTSKTGSGWMLDGVANCGFPRALMCIAYP